MGVKVSVDAAVRFTKLSVYLAHSWPPARIETKFQSVKLELLWFASILSSLGLLVPLTISIFNEESTSLVRIQSACFVGAICNYIVKMIVYRVQRKSTQEVRASTKIQLDPCVNFCTTGDKCFVNFIRVDQKLINEMEDFLKTAKAHEKIVLQRYVDRIFVFHGIITFVNYWTSIIIICGPLFLPQQLPTDAVYPFSLDSRLGKYIAYLHQSFVGFQCSTGATIDCQTALTMWFAAARLELLAHELRNVNDPDGFRCFVQKHQRLLWYAKEASQTTSYIALTTSIMCGFGTIFSGLQLLSNQPFAVKLQFGPVVVVAAMNLFVCCWPADNLIKVCHMMGTAVYDASWIGMSSQIMRNYLMVLRRSQRAVIVSIGGFIPTLSLRSYTSYLSTAFSYTTTLRVILSAG